MLVMNPQTDQAIEWENLDAINKQNNKMEWNVVE